MTSGVAQVGLERGPSCHVRVPLRLFCVGDGRGRRSASAGEIRRDRYT
jgi:hypothetical protein